MLIENNPLTSYLHKNWKERIIAEFKEIDFSNSTEYLSLISYLDNSPAKFYSKEAYDKYFDALEYIKNDSPQTLSNILKEVEPLLSISNKILTEINEKPIHDIILPKEHNDLINFIDKEIHYNLLKIYETPFFQFSYILAKYHWIKENKGTNGLDLYNSVEQLKKVGFDFITPLYLHDVRNGIAHGKIIFSDFNITYIDKRGNKEKISIRKIIDTLDGILNITNGFCLAFKVFCFTNNVFFETNKIPIPQSILLEELQAKANAPAWKITNCLESEANEDKRQLIIYAKNDNWDYSKVNWHCFATAYWSEALTKCYDRIFFHLHSSHSKGSPIGWAAYNGEKLRQLRERNETKLEEYRGVLENDFVFFIPKLKFPKFVYSIGSYISAAKIIFPLQWKNYRTTYFPNIFLVRDTQMHSKGLFTVIQDPSVIVKSQFQNDIPNLIRSNKKKIVRLTIKYSRNQFSFFSLLRYLPVRHIRVFIYDTDMRVRNLRNSGLIPELIATIEVNTSKHIRTIDILGGKLEQHGKYRIVWNKKWMEKQEDHLLPI